MGKRSHTVNVSLVLRWRGDAHLRPAHPLYVEVPGASRAISKPSVSRQIAERWGRHVCACDVLFLLLDDALYVQALDAHVLAECFKLFLICALSQWPYADVFPR